MTSNMELHSSVKGRTPGPQKHHLPCGHPGSQVLKIEILKSVRSKRAPGACLNPGPQKVHLDPGSQVLKVKVLKTWQNTYTRVHHGQTTGPDPAKTGEGLTSCDGGQQGRARHGRVPGGFQNWNLKTFRTWFSGCGISILGPGLHTRGFTAAFGHGHPLV
jgi:hypothetical protein